MPVDLSWLDKVEQFCRERGIIHYCDFMDAVSEEDAELVMWADMPGRGMPARYRGIEARIAKVRAELK